MVKFKKYFPEFYDINPDIKEFESLEELLKSIELLPNYSWKYDDYFNCQLLIQERFDHSKWWVVGYVYDYDLSKELSKINYKLFTEVENEWFANWYKCY